MTVCVVNGPTIAYYTGHAPEPSQQLAQYLSHTPSYYHLDVKTTSASFPVTKTVEEPLIRVTIASMAGAEEVVTLKPSMSVQDLKERITQSRLGANVQVSDMRLHHLGLQLQDLKQTLRSCGVQTGSTVQMVVVSKEKAPRKARLFLRGTEMKAFDVHLTISVREAAQEARALCGMDESYVLTFRGHVLDESMSLKEAGVEMGNVMKLTPREDAHC